MNNNSNKNQTSQGRRKPGKADQGRQSGQRTSQQGGFQHEPKPGADQQNENPSRQSGKGGAAQTRQSQR